MLQLNIANGFPVIVLMARGAKYFMTEAGEQNYKSSLSNNCCTSEDGNAHYSVTISVVIGEQWLI